MLRLIGIKMHLLNFFIHAKNEQNSIGHTSINAHKQGTNHKSYQPKYLLINKSQFNKLGIPRLGKQANLMNQRRSALL